ncbi:MAG: SUKH-4 family immunity protein, partial [Cyanobacteria bacterium J06642_11]
MISASEFRKQWCDDEDFQTLVSFSEASLMQIHAPEASKKFLTEAGLPDAAAPFLNFQLPESGQLETVTESWGLSPEYNRYLVVGFNGFGDPICLDEACNGQIIYLN